MLGESHPRDDSPSSESLMGNEDRLSSKERAKTSSVPSDTLRRAPHILILALLYAAIALFAWTVHCTLTRRPIGAKSYYADLHAQTGWWDYLYDTRTSFGQTDRYLRAAEFCQSLAGVLTIPLTSMVCSCAAVAFLQQRTKQSWRSLTLRQSMALADKGWNDPVLITKLIAGGWKRYGSFFLVFALILNLIGASISPLQSLFVSSESIKIPTERSSSDLIDLQNWIDFASRPNHDDDMSLPTTQIRSRLMSTKNTDPQFRLWSRGAGCRNSSDEFSQTCAKSGQSTFGNLPNLSDPFWAQPPVGFQTGLLQQFAPRINFTTQHQNISADDFPKDCKDKPGALYLHYANMTDLGGYIVDVCMPADQTVSPWKATRKRQDFSEELYIKMTLDWTWEKGELQFGGGPFIPGNYSFKIVLNTTAGYFELPNYHNGQLPGPLLDDRDNGPEQDCGAQCKGQASDVVKRSSFEAPKNGTEKSLDDLRYKTKFVLNKGPLLSTTLSLFALGSYLDIHHTVTEAYKSWSTSKGNFSTNCFDVAPLVKLLRGEDNDFISLNLDPCVSSATINTQGIDQWQLRWVAEYMSLFTGVARSVPVAAPRWSSPSAKHIQNAFTAAAFIAVDEWMQQSTDYQIIGTVSWDLGADQQIPTISHAGEVLISTLLGIYLFCILGLSLYVTWKPRWTDQLDSFAMMRIGSAAPGHFPLQLAHNPDEVGDLDKLPGWIGGTPGVKRHETDNVYELGLGGEESLNRKRRYHCYATKESSEG